MHAETAQKAKFNANFISFQQRCSLVMGNLILNFNEKEDIKLLKNLHFTAYCVLKSFMARLSISPCSCINYGNDNFYVKFA